MPKMQRLTSNDAPPDPKRPDDDHITAASPDSLISQHSVPSQYDDNEHPVRYRRYKRRFFGLAQLVLLNIIVSYATYN
jgi:hypothetical protein